MTQTTPTRNPGGTHLGSATLVMLFSVICLTIFAVLAVVTANNSWTLAEKSADAVTNYYAADSIAIEICNQITTTYQAENQLIAPEGYDCQLEELANETRLSYWVAIDDNQSLWVELVASQGTIQIAHWQVAYTGTWSADQTITVWGG